MSLKNKKILHLKFVYYLSYKNMRNLTLHFYEYIQILSEQFCG